MPLGAGFFGTNADSSEAQEYCVNCFRDGAFVDPELTVDQMVQRSVDFMTQNLHMPEEVSRQMSQKTIPLLRRWNA